MEAWVEQILQQPQRQLVQMHVEHVARLVLVLVVREGYHLSGVDGRIGLQMLEGCLRPSIEHISFVSHKCRDQSDNSLILPPILCHC